MTVPDLVLDPKLRVWVLFPILFVMILFGMIRHYANILIASQPKSQEVRAIREQQFMAYAQNLRVNGSAIADSSFTGRQKYYSEKLKSGTYLKNPDAPANSPPNFSDPSNMENLMGMVKSQALNFVPQTVMMSWVNALFSGFVLSKFFFLIMLFTKSVD